MSYCETSGGITTRRVIEWQLEVPRSRVGLINQQPASRGFSRVCMPGQYFAKGREI